jgi:hypothetical protein
MTTDGPGSVSASGPPRPPRYQLSRRQAWFANPRTDADGAIRSGAHLRALAARTAGEPAPLTARYGIAGAFEPPAPGGPQWNPLGPAGVGLGQADGDPRVSGRVLSIAAHRDGQRAYAGTASGGTWYTDDAGRHWRCLDTYAEAAPLTGRAPGQADALAVSAVTVEWGAGPGTDVVYAGTGEPAGLPNTFYGVGVRVATGPAAADRLDPTVSRWQLEAPDLVNKGIYRLAADPARPGVVYAATTAGLWRRAGNAGAESTVWTKVSDPSVGGDRVTDVVIAPAGPGHPQTIYVATSQQVWRSQTGDDGSWAAVPGYTATERTSLAVAPGDPSVVYALSRGIAPSPRRPVPTNAARLHNGRFEPISISSLPVDLTGDSEHNQAFYDTVIAVDPLAADVIWMGGKDVWSPDGAEWNAALFRGQVKPGTAAGTWKFVFRPANQDEPGADPSWVGAGAHADVHAIEFSADASTVWVGCDGGIFQAPVVTPPPAHRARGVARNTAVGPWRACNDGLAITQPVYLAQTPVSDSLMLAGTQDNGVEQRIGPAAWKVARRGDGGGCAIDPADPNRRFAQYHSFSWFFRTDPEDDYDQTLDYQGFADPRGKAWVEEDRRAAFYSGAAAQDLGNGATALAFGSYRVWYCEDWGTGTPAGAGWRTLPTGTNPYKKKDASGHHFTPDLNQDSLPGPVIRVGFIDDDRLLVLTQGPPAALHLLTRGRPWTLDSLSAVQVTHPLPGVPHYNFPPEEIPIGLAVDDPEPGSCYVTLGAGQNPRNPDIDHVWWFDGSHWWPCGFDATVADTPVNAAVVDSDHTVYVGTDVGVWKGVPDKTVTPPAWNWSPCSHGLPDAPVLDLVWCSTPHLLRAATHGRGVWELNLDETAPVTETYLRAHPADTRRVFPAGGKDPATSTDPPPAARIDASPDIVIARTPSPVRANHLDMALLDRIKPKAGPAGGPSLQAPPHHAVVYVQVNARGWQRRPAGTVHVGLLATPRFDATLARLPALPDDWVAQFRAAVTTAPGKWLTGGTRWAWIGTPATLATARPLHPEEPQVVRFAVTFPRPPGATALPKKWTLLAVADDPLDPLSTAPGSVHDLVLNDRHVAVRSVALISSPAK